MSSRWTESPISHVVGLGQLDVDEDAVVVEVVHRALLHADLEDAVEAVDVDRREELLDGLAVVVGDLGRSERLRPAPGRRPATSATCSAIVGEKPLKPPNPPPSLITTKSPMNPREISLSIDALADSANTSSSATRLTPISSADAVAEVRFGLRAAFSTASFPVMPLAVDTPRPASRTLGPGQHRSDGDGRDARAAPHP